MLHQDWQNYFLCRAEKAWGGTREGTDAVLKVFTASRTGRWYAAVLGIRFGIGTIGREPGKMFFLPKQLHLCWLESVGLDAITVWTEGTYTSHRHSHAIWLGACSKRTWQTHTWQTLMTEVIKLYGAKLSWKFTVMEYSSFHHWPRCPWAMQGHVLLEEWEKWEKTQSVQQVLR